MHVVVLPSFFSTPEYLNSGIFFRHQAEALSSHVERVSVLYVEHRSLKVLSIKKIIYENHLQITDTLLEGVKYYRMHAWNPLAQFGTLGGRIWAYLTLLLFKKYVKIYGKPDIIHAHNGLWAGYAAKIIKKEYGIPFVLTEHSSGVLTDVLSPKQEFFLKKVYVIANEIIAVGKKLAKKVYNISNKQISIIPNLVNVTFFEPKHYEKNYKNVFCFVSIGHLISLKGFDILIEAFSKTFKDRTDIRLNIVGEGVLYNELGILIKEYHVENQIKLLGRLDPISVKHELEKSDAFVLASHFETFGVVFIEAMSMGLPVIGTRCGGPEDFVTKETGILVEPKNVEILSSALKEMVDNRDKYDSKLIRDYIISHYSADVVVQQILSTYKKAISDTKITS